MHHLLPVVLALGACTPLLAQLGAPLPDPQFPAGGHRIDVQAVVQQALGQGHQAFLGCARDTAGRYFVSVARAPGGQHLLVELAANGAFVAAWPQPAAVQGSQFGLRDLAYDGAHTIYGGAELALTGNVVFAFDVPSRSWLPTANWPLPAGFGLTTVRGLAYRPAGASGLGTLLASDWNSGVFEFDRSGALLRHLPGAQTLDVFGLAVDTGRDTMWMLHQVWFHDLVCPDYAPGGTHATEVDLAFGDFTGVRHLGDQAAPGLAGLAGGAECYLKNGVPTLLLLTQAASDTLSEVGSRFDQGASCGGNLRLATGRFRPGSHCLQLALAQDPGDIGALLFDFGGAVAPLLGAPFASGCLIYPANPLTMPVRPITGGFAQQNLWLPSVPGVQGLPMWLQWASLSTSTLTAFTSSAGAAVIQ
jgi:hypothetical protein